jgi:lipoprotein-anchoring transpeptidase ErfK/SrfK
MTPELPRGVRRLVRWARLRLDTEAGCAVVDVAAQRLYWVEPRTGWRSYPVSTARAGVGSVEGSLCTPAGLHRVSERIGAGAPVGAVFRGRRATGEIAPILADPVAAARDAVTTRILRLDGLDAGLNRGAGIDTRARYVYIHGTPEEGLIGQPASIGCIRMRNADVIDLFERVPEGAPVVIARQPAAFPLPATWGTA